MTDSETISLDACTDCYMFILTGDMPEPTGNWHWSDGLEKAEFPDGWHPSKISANWPKEAENANCGPWTLHNDDGQDHEEFSSASCDCCGSSMAGTRYYMLAVRRVYSDLELIAQEAPIHNTPTEAYHGN
jgi:hypothetical protein